MLKKRENLSINQSYNLNYNYSKRINYYLYKKYSKNDYSYSKICTNNLITHQTCRIVARFTDFLIFDDNTEFLHEFCGRPGLYSRLQYIFNFYSSYSKIYPNYLIIPENKFLYKNLRKKQKIIDEENALKFCTPKNRKSTKNININNHRIKNSINNNDNNLNKNNENNKSDSNDELVFFNKNIIESINRQNLSPNNNQNNISTKKKCSKISYSHELNYSISSNSSERKKSCYNNNNNNNDIDKNIPRKIFDSINKKKLNLDLEGKEEIMILKNKLYDYNNDDVTFGTHNSSNINNNFYSENKKSKESLTEIINLINGKNLNNIFNKIKNGSYDKINKKKVDKIKKNSKHKFNFLMLDFGIIKKNIKSNKSKLYKYNVKTEKNITPSNIKEIKEETKNNKKNNHLKNYPQKKDSNENNQNKNFAYHKQAVSCLEDISKILRNKKNTNKRQNQLKIVSKLNKNKKNSRSNDHNSNLLSLTNIGKVIIKQHKRNDVRINKNNSIKIKNSKNHKNLNFVSNKSTNSTLNFGNSYYKGYKTNNNIKYLTEIQNSIENNKNCNKYKNNLRIIKSIETLMSIAGEERKSKILKGGEMKRVFKLETDSLQSTQVSLNRKPNQKSSQKITYIDKILTQIKKTIKNLNKSKNDNNNTALSSFSKKCNTD